MTRLSLALLLLAACAPARSGDDPDAGSDGGIFPGAGRVYASTQSELYELDPVSKALTLVGTYDCIHLTADPADTQDGMADIAVDKDGGMFGVGRVSDGNDWALVSIDTATASCSIIAAVDTSGVFPCGLSFVPAGTVDPLSEALVGVNTSGDYFRFDLATGARTPLGSLGVSPFSKGADLVSIIGGKTYTTGQGDPDRLFEMDPATGAMVREVGSTGIDLIAGLGFWAGTLYAFNYEGRLFAVDPDTAQASEITIPDRPAGLFFWGAAVTTSAPPIP